MALSLSNLSFSHSKPSLGGFGPGISRRLHLRLSSLDHRLPADPSLSLRHFKKRKSPRRTGDCSAGGVGGFANVITASADYYSTLGVPRSASNKEIKAAYRRLARQVLVAGVLEPFLSLISFSSASNQEIILKLGRRYFVIFQRFW